MLLIGPIIAQSQVLASPESTRPFGAQVSQTSVQPTQVTPSACLSASKPDISNALIPASTSTSHITGNAPTDVKTGTAKLIAPVQNSSILHVSVVFGIRNANSFYACLASINDPTSPDYEHFLNTETLAPYIETPGEKASVMSYLTASGLTVIDGPSPLVLEASGGAATVERAFNVHVNYYRSGNHTYYSADSDPTMPENYAQEISAVRGLDNYTTVKHLNSPGCEGPYCGPGLEVGYGMTSLYSKDLNGNGVTVAVVDQPGDPNAALALTEYDESYNLPDPNFQVLCGGGTTWASCSGQDVQYDPGWASEAAMDIEAVHSMAPGAAIKLFYGCLNVVTDCTGDPLLDAIDYIASNHIASIVSNSWTYGTDGPLQSGDPSWFSATDQRLALDAAQGLTILFASGDAGSDSGTYFPASDPNVLAVGATDLALLGCGNLTCAAYSGEDGSSISGGGYSPVFAEPTWQANYIGPTPGGYQGHGRGLPDVSMMGYSPGLWVYSTQSNFCGGPNVGAGWFGCTGTSLSTPLWAGVLAVALQAKGAGNSFGNIAPTLYSIGSSASYSTTFHDIITGSNGAYNAGKGWDAVTGWGSPIGSGLVTFFQAGQAGLSTVPLTVNYAVVGGGTPTAPVFTYKFGGTSKSLTLKTTPTTVYADNDSTWSVSPSTLQGSTTAQQWQAPANSLTGTTSGPMTQTFSFYRQYALKVSYSITGGGTPAAPSFTAKQYGTATSVPLTKTSTLYWFDAESAWSIPNPLPGSSTNEQWETTHSPSGTVTGSGTISFSYQHQYLLTMTSNSTDGKVSPSSGWQNAASSVTIQATPDAGYAFTGWRGTGPGSYTGIGNAATVKMNGPISQTGDFAVPILTVNPITPTPLSHHAPITLEVQVLVSGRAVAAAHVTIFVNGLQAPGCSGLTNTEGYFSCTYSATAGTTYTWYATVTKTGYQPATSTYNTFKTS